MVNAGYELPESGTDISDHNGAIYFNNGKICYSEGKCLETKLTYKNGDILSMEVCLINSEHKTLHFFINGKQTYFYFSELPYKTFFAVCFNYLCILILISPYYYF